MRSRPLLGAKQTQGCILVQARMDLCPMDSTASRVASHWSARSRGYKLSRERADPRSLQGRCVCVCRHESSLDVTPASPFIVSKGRLGLHLW
jgi:hypothetical protein